MNALLGPRAMEAQAALAFVARREGHRAMPATRWRHVLSLELGWMTPGLAGRYVEACTAAGLLEIEGDDLRLTFDPKHVEIRRGFRPDPENLPAADGAPHVPGPAEDADLFASWLPKVAAARGEDLGVTMEAMEALQARAGGLLHAEAAILVLAAQAGLDVAEAAGQALTTLQA